MSEKKIPVCDFESSKFSMVDTYEVVRILRRHGVDIDWNDDCGECFFYGANKENIAQIIHSDSTSFVLGLTDEDQTIVSAFDEYFESKAKLETPSENYSFVYSWSA